MTHGGKTGPDISEISKRFLGPMILQIGVIGADGFQVTGTSNPGVRIDLGDREHYRAHLNTGKDDLFISKPVIGSTSGNWSVQLSRRIYNTDGSFGGVIVASVDPHYLAGFDNPIDTGQNGMMLLVGLDGVIRAARHLDAERVPTDGALFMKLQESPTGFGAFPGRLDGVVRLGYYRKTESLPLIVVVGLARDEVLADYRRHQLSYYAAASVFTAIFLVAIGLGIRQARHTRTV